MSSTFKDAGLPRKATLINTKPKQLMFDRLFNVAYEFWLTFVPIPDRPTDMTTALQTDTLQDEAVFYAFVVRLAEQMINIEMGKEPDDRDREMVKQMEGVANRHRALLAAEIKKIRPTYDGRRATHHAPKYTPV